VWSLNIPVPSYFFQMDAELRQLGIEAANELRQRSKAELVRHFGERTGIFLYLAARGKVEMARAVTIQLLAFGPA
jgi:hypothetical protein